MTPTGHLHGRVALVTCPGRGIVRGLALRFSPDGPPVPLLAFRPLRIQYLDLRIACFVRTAATHVTL